MTLPRWVVNLLAMVLPDNWLSPLLAWLATTYWQEWVLISMGLPFFLLFLVEWALMKRQNRATHFRLKRSVTNFSLGGSYLLFEMAIQMTLVLPFCVWLYRFRIWTIPVTVWTALPIFIGIEFCYYWFHRASHRINWFWTAHVVHHSDDGMNLSTAMRQSLLYSVTGWWLFFVPLMLLGVHPIWVFFFYALNLIYQYFIHTELVDKLPGWAEYIFDTPSNHRAHHGSNAQYIDKNYGGVLIIFDRWFGTYVREDEPVTYGAVGHQASDNLVKLIFGQFVAMWQAVWHYKSLKPLWVSPERFEQEFTPSPKP